MAMQWKILAIHENEDLSEELVIYAAQRGSLELQVYSLNISSFKSSRST